MGDIRVTVKRDDEEYFIVDVDGMVVWEGWNVDPSLLLENVFEALHLDVELVDEYVR